MRIERIELRRIHMPYVRPFETSGWRHEGSDAVIVRVDADGETGWGESPVSDGPWYNEETFHTALMSPWQASLVAGGRRWRWA